MNGDVDPDDWFAEPRDTERTRRTAPPREGRPSAGTARRHDERPPARRDTGGLDLPDWLTSLDRRIVAAAAIAVVLLVVGLAVGGVFSSGGGAPALTTTTAPPTTTTTPTTTTSAPPASHVVPAPGTTLKPGDTGAQVIVLQQALASLGFSSGKADGQYGPSTTTQVKAFQTSVKIAADGVLGPATLKALKKALRTANAGTS